MDKDEKILKEEEFDKMMDRRVNMGFTTPRHTSGGRYDERTEEVNKKLPSWSLEPPQGYLK